MAVVVCIQFAMEQFQKHYIDQLENYYKSIEDTHKKEEEYRYAICLIYLLLHPFHTQEGMGEGIRGTGGLLQNPNGIPTSEK